MSGGSGNTIEGCGAPKEWNAPRLLEFIGFNMQSGAMKPFFSKRAVWLAAALAVLAGCGKNTPQKPAAGHPLPAPLVAKCEPGQPGGRLTLVADGAPRTFNPLLASDGASDELVHLLFGSLVNLDLATQEPGPGLAVSWSVAPDQKTWTFKLRRGVRWSDGWPFTADDVVFTWNQVMYNPKFNQLTYDVFRIGGKNFTVSRVDELTVRVVTPEVFAPMLEFFGSVPILPIHAIGPALKERPFPWVYALDTPPGRVAGCGPFRVKESKAGQFVLLERNPEYWVVDKEGRRLPYFDEVLLVPGGRGAESLLFLNGKSDAAERVRHDDYDMFKQAATNARVRLVELGVGAEQDFLWFNLNTGSDILGKPFVSPAKLKWFRDKRFRQAVSCAIDRERLAREVYGGRAQPIHGIVSAESRKWNNPDIPRYAYEPARARALLAEIGIQDRRGDGTMKDANGNRIEIVFNSNVENPTRAKCAALMAEDLQKLGVKLVYQTLVFEALVDKVNKTFDYECVLMGLTGGGGDPASQMNVLKSSDELHQWFPRQKTPSTDWEARVDQLMDAQMRTLDFAQRKKSFDEVQAILAEELPMIYTVAPFAFAAIRSDVGNVRPSILTPYRRTWNAGELYFKKPSPTR